MIRFKLATFSLAARSSEAARCPAVLCSARASALQIERTTGVIVHTKHPFPCSFNTVSIVAVHYTLQHSDTHHDTYAHIHDIHIHCSGSTPECAQTGHVEFGRSKFRGRGLAPLRFARPTHRRCDRKKNTERVSVYTILSLPILYGVWHIKGGSEGGYIWRKRRAIVLQ